MTQYHSGYNAVHFPSDGRYMTEGTPFHYQGDNNPSVVVCFHGLTATPYETQLIGRACLDNGIDAVAPLLPCHGIADPEEAFRAMRQVSYRDWLEAARGEIEASLQRYEEVFVYGQSMGGALALVMASEFPVRACAVTAPALVLPLSVRALTNLVGWMHFKIKKSSDLQKFFNPQYPFQHFRAVRQTALLAKLARRRLAKIDKPVFVAHSRNDPLIRPKAVALIAQSGLGPTQIRWFDRSGHVLPLDVDKDEVARSIADFFARDLQCASMLTQATT
ncbi:MAG: alpha/beta hydrolase [Gemmataceae bacterium]